MEQKYNKENAKTNKPLSGVRILSVEQYIAGPYCSMLLSDAGAEIIKIERPLSGDPRRSIGPMYKDQKGEMQSGGFLEYNRNKKSLTLNLQDSAGQEIFKKLVKDSDALLVNLRPGSLRKYGLGYEDLKLLNDGLVYASITGFGELNGHQGPYWDRPAFDIVAEAMSGIMELVGFPDKPPHFTIFGMADLVTAVFTAYGIMLALFQRTLTGQGQFVESPMYDSMLAINERAAMLYSVTGESPTRGGENVQGPRGAFRAQDGYIAFNVPTDEIWLRFLEISGLDQLKDDPRCSSGPQRAKNTELYLRPAIEEWLSGITREEAVDLLNQSGVPAGPVNKMDDVFNCPQIRQRKMLIDVEGVNRDSCFRLVRSPVLLSGSPDLCASRIPALGENTEEIMKSLGYDFAAIESFRQDRVI